MSVTVKDVEHVARLARLRLDEADVDLFVGQMNAILQYVDKLNELDTDDVEPTSHPVPLSNVMRDDAVRPSWPIESVLRNAPDEEDGQFRVPAVLE